MLLRSHSCAASAVGGRRKEMVTKFVLQMGDGVAEIPSCRRGVPNPGFMMQLQKKGDITEVPRLQLKRGVAEDT